MVDALDQTLLEALLDSWDRNNAILVNLLRAVPEGGLAVRAMERGPSVAEMFTHMHYARLVLVLEDAPESAKKLPEEEWAGEPDPERIALMLNESAKVVREAVKSRVAAGRDMDRHYDHPILMLQHLIWHEGYHHGQIKLALKLAGRPISDKEAGPVTWWVWMRKVRSFINNDYCEKKKHSFLCGEACAKVKGRKRMCCEDAPEFATQVPRQSGSARGTRSASRRS